MIIFKEASKEDRDREEANKKSHKLLTEINRLLFELNDLREKHNNDFNLVLWNKIKYREPMIETIIE